VDHDATASQLEGKDDELPLLERRNRSYGLLFASVCALVNMRPNNIVKIQLIRNRGWIICGVRTVEAGSINHGDGREGMGLQV
jgi:hypothetical protein